MPEKVVWSDTTEVPVPGVLKNLCTDDSSKNSAIPCSNKYYYYMEGPCGGKRLFSLL